MKMKIEGIITAMVTPLDERGIDREATIKLVNHLIDTGVHGLFILGTNGEFYALSHAEKIELAKIVVEEAAGRVPVFAGAGGISTSEVTDLVNEFQSIGVTAASIITPYLIKLSDEEVINHYKMIATETELPLILYNIPKNTGIHINETIFEQLIELPNIIGIKDSSGELDNIKNYVRLNKRKDFSILVGSDSLILKALELGADGAVAATSNVLTKTDLNIYKAFKKNKIDQAEMYQESIEEFRRILKLSTVPSILKYSVSWLGISVGNPKLPVIPVNETLQEEIHRVLEAYRRMEERDE
jgi:4-hydroxy-tetrahydrodipicolinate synthase